MVANFRAFICGSSVGLGVTPSDPQAAERLKCIYAINKAPATDENDVPHFFVGGRIA